MYRRFLVAIVALLAFLFVTEWHKPFGLFVRDNSTYFTKRNRTNVSYCSCSHEDIDDEAPALLSLLNNITLKPYFRYIKVNTEKICPYWAVSLLCSSHDNACQLCECDVNQVPEALKKETDMADVLTPSSDLLHLPMSALTPGEFCMWGEHTDGCKYVDIVAHPESNTGFVGPMANRVWEAIYNENCLMLENRETCEEVKVLRTFLSGLQYSIMVHIVTNFKKDPELTSPLRKLGLYKGYNESFWPNCKMFREKVQPFTDRLHNLHVLYQFVLRAVTKAKPHFLDDLDSFRSNTSGPLSDDDNELFTLLSDLYDSKLMCRSTFDETKFLESPNGRQLVPQFAAVVHNITTIMDCVSCEKCRLWGKIQTKGIFTAMRIIMNENCRSMHLDRSEKFVLINFLRQLTFSIRSLALLPELCMHMDL